ncbi:cytochrome P450 [Penicillium vulpinum]|uniref:cytochrome P450 n=1 Tax=Penicillium vulpinum TaxID=29845 RepID=UPI0025479E9B|nr:cytochrome P450 [Penicillium vulpinum]KAJ5958797.1 cytochrome P450 [Penicillium vulpinum]
MAFYEVLLSSQNILGLEIPRIIAGLSFLLAAILAVRLVRRIYRVCWNPLKNFKGLPEAAVSEDWLYRTTEFGTAEQVFEALHRKYSRCPVDADQYPLFRRRHIPSILPSMMGSTLPTAGGSMGLEESED